MIDTYARSESVPVNTERLACMRMGGKYFSLACLILVTSAWHQEGTIFKRPLSVHTVHNDL